MKAERKVAWKKNSRAWRPLLEQLRRGKALQHEQIASLARGETVEFSTHHRVVRDKSDYIIFQYSVAIRRSDGRFAVFDRVRSEADATRVTFGRSLLISRSSLDAPHIAVPNLISDKVSFGQRITINRYEPVGICFNPLPHKHGHPQPAYLHALYLMTAPPCRLNGLVRDYPDTFLGWMPPSELLAVTENHIDKMLLESLAARTRSVTVQPHGAFLSPRATIATSGRRSRMPPVEIEGARTVFVSHSSKDSFAAYAALRFLSNESNGRIYPFADIRDIDAGDPLWAKAEHLIDHSDVLVVLVTNNTASAGGVQKEVEYARRKGIPVVGFWLSGDLPGYLKGVWVNELSRYPDWRNECRRICDHMLKYPYRHEGSQQSPPYSSPAEGSESGEA